MVNDLADKCPDIPLPILTSFVKEARGPVALTEGDSHKPPRDLALQMMEIQSNIERYREISMTPKERMDLQERSMEMARKVNTR